MKVIEKVVFRPVGVVRTSSTDDEVRMSSEELESTIDIFPDFQEALDGLVGFSHLFVLSYFHKLRPEQVGFTKVRPRRMLRFGMRLDDLPLVGVFAIGSPTRPNPIGLSLARLLRVVGTRLIVQGLDCFDGTPVLDIKAYRDGYRAEKYKVAEWYRKFRDMENQLSTQTKRGHIYR